MPRRLRRRSEWSHVFNRGVARDPVFHHEIDRRDFVRILGRTCREHDLEVHAWCLMTNHYHLIVRDGSGALSDAMQLLGTTYVRHLNDRLDRDGPLFRGRFGSRPIESHAYLRWLARYVHRNPVAIVGEDGLADYRWSSLPDYLGARRGPSWLRTDRLLGYFGGDVASFRRFVVDDAERTGWDLDDDEILAAIDQMVDDHAARTGASPRATRSALLRLLDLDDPAERGSSTSRSARSRARRRERDDPEFASLARAARHLAA